MRPLLESLLWGLAGMLGLGAFLGLVHVVITWGKRLAP